MGNLAPRDRVRVRRSYAHHHNVHATFDGSDAVRVVRQVYPDGVLLENSSKIWRRDQLERVF